MEADQRSVLITGCSSGIGRTTALLLRDRGYRVFAAVRHSKDIAARAGAGRANLRLDLSSSESLRAAVAEILGKTQGRLHGIGNNGAYGQPGIVDDLTHDALSEQFETNVFGAQELANLIILASRAQGSGRIVQINSLLSAVCLAYCSAYGASKFAFETLSDTLRLELRTTGIHVCLVEPGPISSRFRENAYQAYLRNIDRANSVHHDYSTRVEARRGGTKLPPFTLTPEAVARKVECAPGARHPKIRYPVTAPTRFLAAARRLLTGHALDGLATAIGSGGQRRNHVLPLLCTGLRPGSKNTWLGPSGLAGEIGRRTVNQEAVRTLSELDRLRKTTDGKNCRVDALPK